METILPDEHLAPGSFTDDETDVLTAPPTAKMALEKKNRNKLPSINLTGDKLVVMDELPGLYFEGTQYYDLKGIGYISNAGLANLIEFLKSLLKKGVEVRFVNVNDKIKNKIRALGLEHVINCT